MSSAEENVLTKENVKIMPRSLGGIYCFICSDWTLLKVVKTTMKNGNDHYEDVCTDCDTGYAYTPFTCTEINEIENALNTIGVTQKQVDEIVKMISSNKNTKYKFNESFGSVYTKASLDSVRRREIPDQPEQCLICFDLPESSTSKTLDCSHIVCTPCFERMDKDQCPLCRCYFEWNGDIERIL